MPAQPLIKLSPTDEQQLVARAQSNWSRCFGHKNTRHHMTERVDKAVKRKAPEPPDGALAVGAQPTERSFMRRVHASLATSARPTLPAPALPAWKATHSKEQAFQHCKLSMKFVEANLQGLLLASEQSEAVQAAIALELARMEKSFKERLSQASRMARAMGSQLPTAAEMHRATLFIDSGVDLPAGWAHSLAQHEARVVNQAHLANMYASKNPWHPQDIRVKWGAALAGGWVVTPTVFTHGRGACVKFAAALSTPRKVWVDPDFRREHLQLWLLLLEMVHTRHSAKWTFLATAEDWAAAKTQAEIRHRSPEVLALVAGAAASEANHVFDAAGFLNFIARRDDGRGSHGLADM